jgi:hypothetical protein
LGADWEKKKKREEIQPPIMKEEGKKKDCNLSSSATISGGRSKKFHLFSLPFSL